MTRKRPRYLACRTEFYWTQRALSRENRGGRDLFIFVISGATMLIVKSYILIIKANECTISQVYLMKYSTCFGHVHCPSSGVSQHCVHTIVICHASSGGCLLAWSGRNKYLLRVHSVETLPMMDSGHVRNM